MAIKIKKNGMVQDLVINANEVRVLDTDGNFKSKNLESVLKELNATGGGGGIPKEAEYVFVGDTEPDYEGVWLDTSEDSTEVVEGDNGIVEAIRDYIDTDVKTIVEKNKELVQENNKIVKDIQTNVGDRLDVVPQLSGQNLLINGDFQVWQRGDSFNITKDGKYNYTADRWIVQTDSDNIIAKSLNDGGMRIDMSKFNGTYTNVIQLLELPFYKKLIDKTVTIKIKFKNEVSNISIGLRALPDASATHILMNKTSKEFVITAKIPNCSVECTKFMVYIQSKTQQMLDFEYIKMELGYFSTPLTPRSFGEELALCQRYYESFSYNKTIATGIKQGDKSAEFMIEYVVKRNIPTIRFKNKNSIVLSANGVSHVSTDITAITHETEKATIKVTTNESLTKDTYLVQRNDSSALIYEVDSEIY